MSTDLTGPFGMRQFIDLGLRCNEAQSQVTMTPPFIAQVLDDDRREEEFTLTVDSRQLMEMRRLLHAPEGRVTGGDAEGYVDFGGVPALIRSWRMCFDDGGYLDLGVRFEDPDLDQDWPDTYTLSYLSPDLVDRLLAVDAMWSADIRPLAHAIRYVEAGLSVKEACDVERRRAAGEDVDSGLTLLAVLRRN
jgi:hypothetical protein